MTTGDGREAPRASVGGALAAVVLAAMLAAVAVALTFLTRAEAEPYILAVVCGLAALGGVFLVMLAFGSLGGGRPRPAVETRAPDALADGLPEALLVTDPAGRVVTCNAAYAGLAGTDGHRREAVPSLERLLAGDPDAAEPLFRLAAAARQGIAAEEEVRLSRPIGRDDGAPRWYRLSVRPLEGTPPRRVWRIADVTGERLDQESGFLELQSVVHFLDHAPAGFFSTDTDGRIAFLNATLAAWLGYDLARLDAQPTTLADIVDAEGMAVLASLSGGAGEVRTESVDLDLLRTSGERLPVRLLHRVTFAADGTAGDARTLVLPRIATDAATTDGSQRAAETRFARFFNTAPIAIAAVDRDGRLGRANAPFLKLFGGLAHRPPGEPRTRLVDAVIERDREALAEALAAAAAGTRSVSPVDATLAGEGGRSVRFYISPVKDAAADDDEAAVAYVLDTTEQRALETQFAQSQKMQAVGQLAGGVAHDFNNLLTVIIGFADLVLTRYRPNDPFFQDIMQIKQNANRAAGLVRQLLAFSRRQTMRPERIVLNDVLAELSMLLDRLLGEMVELKVVNGRDLWPVMADANQFEQVIVNLAVNARDAMPEGGRLTIRTANVPAAEAAAFAAHGIPAGDYVLTEIADTGRGMSAEVMEKIFEPFFTTKEFGKGTGLGLSTVYGVVKQSNGYITVDSSPGEGTTFRVLLPRASGEAAAWPARGEEGRPILVRGAGSPSEPAAEPLRPRTMPTAPAADAGPGQAREPAPAREPPAGPLDAVAGDAPPAIADLTGSAAILLVEDEDAVRAFATRALASRGYAVHPAASGAEALKVMEEVGGRIDLVVSDVVMPEMDGPTLLRELRRTRPDLKIIFVSGYAEDAFARNLPAGEHFSFLPKPFTLKQLATAVKTVLAGDEGRPD